MVTGVCVLRTPVWFDIRVHGLHDRSLSKLLVVLVVFVIEGWVHQIRQQRP
jgi:hypothetical protein